MEKSLAHLLPRDAFHGTGLEFSDSSVDLRSPGRLDSFVSPPFQRLDEQPGKVRSILFGKLAGFPP
jgi:hypothetical protein